MKEHQYLHFVLPAHCLAPPLQVLSLAIFQLYDTVFFFFICFHSIHQCASKKSLVCVDETLYLA